MNTRTTATVAAITLTLGLTTACTSTQPKAKLGTSPTPSASPSPSASPEPVFELPADFKVTVEPVDAGDDVNRAAILKVNENLIKALLQAMTHDGAKDPAYQHYVLGEGALGHTKELSDFAKTGYTLTGSMGFYKRQVKFKNPGLASVIYCEDQRFAYSKVRSTGKVLKTKPSISSFIIHDSTVERGPDGTWRETSYVWQRKAAECVRN